jgi:hypothetical protein
MRYYHWSLIADTTSGVPPIAKSSEFRNPRDCVILGILGIRGTSWESALPLECLSLRTHLECLSSGYGILGIHGIQGIRGIRGIPCPTSSKHTILTLFLVGAIFLYPLMCSPESAPMGSFLSGLNAIIILIPQNHLRRDPGGRKNIMMLEPRC